MTEGPTQVQKKHVQWGISRVDPQKVPDIFNFLNCFFRRHIFRTQIHQDPCLGHFFLGFDMFVNSKLRKKVESRKVSIIRLERLGQETTPRSSEEISVTVALLSGEVRFQGMLLA